MFYSVISQSNIYKHTLKLNRWKNLDASSPLYFPPSFNSIYLIKLLHFKGLVFNTPFVATQSALGMICPMATREDSQASVPNVVKQFTNLRDFNGKCGRKTETHREGKTGSLPTHTPY